MRFIRALFHRYFFMNILLLLMSLGLMVWGVFCYLDVITERGREVEVPNLINQTSEQAIAHLALLGIRYQVDTLEFNPKFNPFQVLKVYPRAGAHIKPNREVVLKINPEHWAEIQLPDLVNKYKYLAFSQLSLLGLKVRDTIYQQGAHKDMIISVLYNGNPVQQGDKLPKFSQVDLVVGQGVEQEIRVPNLLGLTLEEAQLILAQTLLEKGILRYEERDFSDGNGEDSARIYFQNPTPNSIYHQGLQVDLWLSHRQQADLEESIQVLKKKYKPISSAAQPITVE